MRIIKLLGFTAIVFAVTLGCASAPVPRQPSPEANSRRPVAPTPTPSRQPTAPAQRWFVVAVENKAETADVTVCITPGHLPKDVIATLVDLDTLEIRAQCIDKFKLQPSAVRFGVAPSIQWLKLAPGAYTLIATVVRPGVCPLFIDTHSAHLTYQPKSKRPVGDSFAHQVVTISGSGTRQPSLKCLADKASVTLDGRVVSGWIKAWVGRLVFGR